MLCVIDLAESTVLSTVPHSLSPQSHRHLDQGKEGYLLYGLRKEPSCKVPHIHRYCIFTRNMGQVHIGGCAANQNVSGHRYSIIIFQTMTSSSASEHIDYITISESPESLIASFRNTFLYLLSNFPPILLISL